MSPTYSYVKAAPVVSNMRWIIGSASSMTTSGADDMPPDASFLLSRNRANVAIIDRRSLSNYSHFAAKK